MKRPLAYITAAWCGSDAENAKQAAQYCRSVYEAGFSPICPTLFHPLFLNDAIPEEHKSGIDMARNLLKRSHVLVVCGHTYGIYPSEIAALQKDYADLWGPLSVLIKKLSEVVEL